MKYFKSLSIMLLLCAVIITAPIDTFSQDGDRSQIEHVQSFSEDAPVLLAFNMEAPSPVMQEDPGTEAEGSGNTAQDIAEVIEEKIQPIIDEAVEQLNSAPDNDAPAQSWITWALMAAMSFFGVITGIFFSGSKRNLKLD